MKSKYDQLQGLNSRNKKAMILGANGLCGKSLVPMLTKLFPGIELILIDPSKESMPPIIQASPKIEELWHVLSSFKMGKGDILIDLVPELPKVELMQIADSLGVSVINATCCEHQRGTLSLIDLLDKKLLMGRYDWQVPHIPDGGMNPGNINALLGAMVEKYGKPSDVTEWEMDSTIPFNWDGEGFATWSPEEFASEFADESTWEVDGKNIIFLDGPPIDNMRPMPNGGSGGLCQHEEIVKWGRAYGCKARYIYGYKPEVMKAIRQNIDIGLQLPLCRKLKGRTPAGSDVIGLAVKFGAAVKNASISASNESDQIPIGSNATSYLVACGVATAFAMMLSETRKGLNWPDDYGSRWIDFLVGNQLCDVVI